MGRTPSRQATADDRRSAVPSVEFDAAALRLINAVTDGEYLDLSFGACAARPGLSLLVSPTAPAAGVLVVFGEGGGVLGYGLASQVCALIRNAEPDPHRRPLIHLEDFPA